MPVCIICVLCAEPDAVTAVGIGADDDIASCRFHCVGKGDGIGIKVDKIVLDRVEDKGRRHGVNGVRIGILRCFFRIVEVFAEKNARHRFKGTLAECRGGVCKNTRVGCGTDCSDDVSDKVFRHGMLCDHDRKMTACGKAAQRNLVGINTEVPGKIPYILYRTLTVGKDRASVIRLIAIVDDKGGETRGVVCPGDIDAFADIGALEITAAGEDDDSGVNEGTNEASDNDDF